MIKFRYMYKVLVPKFNILQDKCLHIRYSNVAMNPQNDKAFKYFHHNSEHCDNIVISSMAMIT